MRALVCALLLGGCGAGDPCDPFPDETCLSLEVRGPGLSIDQVGLTALSGFALPDGRSPGQAQESFPLPVRLAVVPGGKFAGTVELAVRGFLGGVVVGADQIHGTVSAGQHLSMIAELGGSHASDLAGVDFSGRPDLAVTPGADLSGVDLAGGSVFVTETSSITDVELMGVWGTSGSNVYVVSLLGDILHSTGDGTWQLQHAREANQAFNVIWGSGSDDVWAGGGFFPCGGTSGGPSPCEALLLHSTGNGQWSTIFPPGTDPNFGVQITAIGGSSKSDLYFALSGTMSISGVLHSTNSGGSFMLQAFNGMAVPNEIFAVSASDIYASRGVGDILHTTGNGTWLPPQMQVADIVDSVFGISATNLYAAASNLSSDAAVVYHSSGNGSWTAQPTGLTLGDANSMTAANANDLYAVYRCGVAHSTGNGQWTSMPLPPTLKSGCPLNKGWAAPDGQLFLVGEKGLILHKR